MPDFDFSRIHPPCPPAGTGVHAWLFGASCALLEHYPDIPDEVAARHLAESATRPLQPTEATDALDAARREGGKPRPKRPVRAPAVYQRAVARPDSEALRCIRHGAGVTPRQALLSLVCRGDASALVCVARTQQTARTAPLSAFSDEELAASAYVVPSPMRARTGVTKAGKPGSARCHDNAGERLWWVFDFDEPDIAGKPLVQASIVMSRYAERCGAIVNTGGKGIHAWVRVLPGESAEDVADDARRIGADPSVVVDLAKLVRMPGGLRDNGERQSILHYDPAAIATGYTPDEAEPVARDEAGVEYWECPF